MTAPRDESPWRAALRRERLAIFAAQAVPAALTSVLEQLQASRRVLYGFVFPRPVPWKVLSCHSGQPVREWFFLHA